MTQATTAPSLVTSGQYNPASTLPSKVVKKFSNSSSKCLNYIRADIWVDYPPLEDAAQYVRRSLAKPPVTDIKVWLECFARMAELLSTRFPEKAPELWSYQTTILKVAYNYEGSSWVAYGRQFCRDMLSRKDLN